MRLAVRSCLAVCFALVGVLALPACNGVWDNGELAVAVSPTPVRTGQALTVTVTNGTQRAATFTACADLGLYASGSTVRVLPASGAPCTEAAQTLRRGATYTATFSLAGVAPGAYVVRFTPTMDGGEALAQSPVFQVTD